MTPFLAAHTNAYPLLGQRGALGQAAEVVYVVGTRASARCWLCDEAQIYQC